MHMMLAKKLIEKGAIRQNTEFEAYYNTHGLSCIADARTIGVFRIRKASISKHQDKVIFEGMIDESSQPYYFTNEEIITLDGMPPTRLASIYNLTSQGEEEIKSKRRGRKPRLTEEVLPNELPNEELTEMRKWKNFGWTHEDIAKQMGLEMAYISQFLDPDDIDEDDDEFENEFDQEIENVE